MNSPVNPPRPGRPTPGRPGLTGGEQNWRWGLGLLGVLVTAALVLSLFSSDVERKELTYTQMITQVNDGKVDELAVDNDTGRVTGKLANGDQFGVDGPSPPIEDDLRLMRAKNVKLTFHTTQPSVLGSVIPFLLPVLLLVGFFWWSSRRAQGQMSGIMSIGRSRAKVYTTERPKTTFADVAGYTAREGGDRRGRRLPEEPRTVQGDRRPDPEGRAARRAARDGQDAHRPGRGR